jgi:beta-N-acetylhexosaminidase
MKFLTSFLLIAFLFDFAGGRTHPLTPAIQPKRFEPSKKSWDKAAKLLKQMSVDEKVGQLVHVGVNAHFANQDSAFFKELKRQVVENKVGGIIFFVGPVYDTVQLANRMQEAAKIPLLDSLDAETGVGMRFESTTVFPWAMAIAATGDPEFARRMGVMTGREAKASGFHYVLAPVLDVNNNADNPVINVRSFGEDPEEVAKYGVAYVNGIQSQGVIATAKHFPGHGDTNVDSHRALPIVDRSRAQLDKVELLPFRRAIDAGIASIMIAHIGLPQIDPEKLKPIDNYSTPYVEVADAKVTEPGFVPASLSSKVQTDMLRNEFGFKGLIVSDAIDMNGLSIYISQEDAGVRALNAGTDILLKPGDTDAVIRGLKRAVASGRVTQQRLDEAVLKQLAWKYELGLFDKKVTSLDALDTAISSKETDQLADDIANRAITLVRNNAGLLPLDRNQKIAFLGISNGIDGLGTPMTNFVATLRQNGVKAAAGYIQENSTNEQVTSARKAISDADVIIVGMYGRVRSGAKNSVGLPESGVAILREALAARKKVIGISFGNPYLLSSFPDLQTYLVAYGDMPSLQNAAARSILGLQDITGRLPITLPGLHPRRTGIQFHK